MVEQLENFFKSVDLCLYNNTEIKEVGLVKDMESFVESSMLIIKSISREKVRRYYLEQMSAIMDHIIENPKSPRQTSSGWLTAEN